MTQFIASDHMIDTNCPVCQNAIKSGSPIEVCDTCRIPYHVECWSSNGGCTTFGCVGSAASQRLGAAPIPVSPYAPPPYAPAPGPPAYYGAPPGSAYAPQPMMYANDSGSGATAVLPGQLQGFNWGGFGLNWIWSIANNTWIGLLCLVPAVSWVMIFVLGFKGNEWAWQNRRWESVEQFKSVQATWAAWGIAFTVLGIIGGIAWGIIFAGTMVAALNH